MPQPVIWASDKRFWPVSPRWVRRRLATGLIATVCAFTLAPVLAGLIGAPAAKGAPIDPVPTVAINVDPSAMIGQDISFDVEFHNSGPVTGFGPFVDLTLPLGHDLNDGISYTVGNATYLTKPVADWIRYADGAGDVTHPFALDSTGHLAVIHGLQPNQQMVVLRLPFGSFTPTQPPATVHVTVHMSDNANVGYPLQIGAVGGFQFGRTALDDPTNDDPTIFGAADTADVTPTIMTVTKTFHGPTNVSAESATGPDFPLSYTLTVTVAPGQTVDAVTVTDALPDSIEYLSIDNPEQFASVTEPDAGTTGGNLVIDFGTIGPVGNTASATFHFIVPRVSSSSAAILDPSSAASATSTDSASAAGLWTPIDPADRDPDGPTTVTAGPATHTFADRAIAIQKSVRKIGGGEVGPDDILEWTIDLQVSDYFALNNVRVSDLLSDGSRFDTNFAPTLSVDGNPYTLNADGMNSANFDHSLNPDGTTAIEFRVSDEIDTRGESGRLVGGCIDAGGSVTPDCTLNHDGATTARIVFHTVVQRTYIDNKQVVEGDTLSNVASAFADVLDTGSFIPTGGHPSDGQADFHPAGASTQISIARGVLSKTIYAINGSTSFPTPVHISPGDRVTYRLTQEFPASRTDDFSITDYLPLPIFAAKTITFSPVSDTTAPDADAAKYGPDDTFHSMCSSDAGSCPDAPPPHPSYDEVANSITFTYGNYALYPAQSSVADILFTVTVSTKPFADGLLLTNQARSQTSNSAGEVVNADAIVQVTLDQPVLAITKGVVGTNSTAGVLAPDTLGVVDFSPTTAPTGTPTCPAFSDALTKPITNAVLTGDPLTNPLNKNLSGVDAGDYVRFAVVVQDTGHAAAFNVQLMDTKPQGFRVPDNGIDMCITNGAGTAIAATNIGGGSGLFDAGIKLVDPTVGVDPDQKVVGALAAGTSGSTDNSAGTNIAVITYTLQVDTSAVPTAISTNTATLLDYTNSPTGDSHLSAILTDDASATFGPPAIAKTLFATGQNNGHSVVIGEKVTYQVTLTVPEGTLPGARVVDTLPVGMGFAGCDSIATLSDNIATTDITTDVVGGFEAVRTGASAIGQNVTFDLGTLVNHNVDNSKAETVVITYEAVVLNSDDNHAGGTLQNAATFSWTVGVQVGSVGPASADILTVHEPALTIQKTASSAVGDAFDSITYTITITNPSAGAAPNGATAFDVVESDLIPTGMTYDGSTPLAEDPGGPTVKDVTVSGQTLTVTWDKIQQGETAVLHYTVKIDQAVAPSASLRNTATLTWTSLPGVLSGERTGNISDPGTTLNIYSTSDHATVDVPAIAAAKSIVATSQGSTSGNNVVVGEIVTYQVELTIPEGVAHTARLVDTLPAGMAFVGCTPGSPITASTGLTTDLAGGWADACNSGAALSVANGGRDVTFGLGNVTNADQANGTAEKITITYDAVVLNLGTNVRGQTLQNEATAHWEDAVPTTFYSNTARGAVLTVVEPKMHVTKTASKTTGDAGDTITFEIAITNDNAGQGNDAFDVNWTDTIPTGLNYVADSLKPKDLSCANPPTSYSQASAPDLSATWLTFPKGGTCILTYSATLANSVPSGSSYTNVTKLTWTSLPGAHNTLHDLSTYNDLASERTGVATDPGEVNDYVSTDDITVNVNQPAPDKSVVTTSEAGTTGTTNLAVGEIVRYRVYATIPEGITDSVSIRDTLTPGLKYLNDNSTRIAFVTNGAGMTSSTLDDASLYKSGNEAWVTDPGNHPTCVLPPGAITAGTGYDPIFNLGNLNNADRDDDAELVVIEFNAFVENVSGNVAGPTPTILSDRAAIWASPPSGDPTPVKLQDSNGPLTQTVVEPDMSMSKTITKHPTDAGDEIDYVITVTNASATAPAYDYHVTDTLPAALVAPPTSIDSSCATSADVSATNHVDLTITEVAPSSSCTVTIKANLVATEPAGETFKNSADGTYTSLPGATGTPNGDPGNATGSTNPGASGDATGERNGQDGVGLLNDYVNSANVDQTLAAPSIVKNAPSMANAPIGQETTFDIVVTLPEGTTRNLIVTDTLEDGLDFVSATPVTAGGLLASPFSGTFTTATPIPTVTTPDGSHHAYALDFGDTVVPVNQDPADDQFEIQVTVRVANVAGNQAGTVRWNSAKLTYTNVATPVDVAAPAPHSVTVMEPDLRLTKSVSSTTPYFGNTLTYTLTLSHGNGTNDIAAHDVTIDDTLPVAAGWTYAGALNSTGCADAETVTDSVSGHVTASFATFPLNHTCVITYQATIGVKPDAHLGATYTNNAVATWTSLAGSSDYERTGAGGIDDYTDPADSTVTVTGVDLVITKSDTPRITAIAGDTLTYSITNKNDGNAQATNVKITETVPVGTVFKTAGSSAGWLLPNNVTACPNNAPAGTVCHFNVGTLNAGQVGITRTFVVAVVDPIAAGLTDIVNTATIADDGTHNADATPEDNTSTDTDHIPQADLRVTKTVNGSASYRPNKNEDVTYTVTVYNDGPDPATNVKVVDLVPAQLTYKSSVPGAGNSYASGSGLWTITGPIPSLGSQTLTITATASSPNDGLNAAQVTHSDDGDKDSTPNNGVTTEDDYATATTDPVVADMGVAKTVDNAHPNKGETVTFTITAHNYGPDAAPNVNVADTIPANLTPGLVTPSVGSWNGSNWAIGTMAVGAEETLTVVATVTTSGAATNTATVTTDAWDLNSSNDSAGAGISQLVNIAVSKTVNDSTPNVGDQVTFTVGVTNTLTNVANTVVIHDALPAGLTLVGSAAPSKGSYDAGTHDWTIATLGPSESVTMTMTATVVGATAMTNTASVASLEETQTTTADDSASATVTPRQADLGVTKNVDNAHPEIGDTVGFTITVTNHGNAVGALDTATNVTVSDLLPAGLTYVSDDGAGAYVSGTGVWTIGTMAKDDTAVLHVTATVSVGGVFPNTATVHSDVYDPIDTNDSSTATVTTRQADIGVTKTVDNATPNVGATIHYTLTVTNNGPDYGVSSLLVHDLVPAGLTVVSAVPSQGSYDQGTGDWTIGNLANGASVSMPVTATVTASGRIDNALAFVSMLQTDTVPGNNSATATINVPAAADLSVTKSEDTNHPDVGSQVTFTLTAHNAGPDNATNVAVADALPAGLTVASSTPSAGTSYAAGTWTIGNLANGADATLTIVADVVTAGAKTNTATISGSEYDPVAGNNTSSVSLDQRVNIVVSKSVDKPTPNVGGTVTFTIGVTNAGVGVTNTAHNVAILDALPAGLTFVSAATPIPGSYDTGTHIWTVGTLAPSETATMTLTATVVDHVAMTNTASMSHVDETQTSTADDSASVTVTPQQADLRVTKSVTNGNPEIGDTITFTVSLRNNGPDTATNVTLSDVLPVGLTYVSKTVGQGTYDQATGVWTVGSLTRSTTVTLQISASIPAGGSWTNTASVSHSDQYDPGPGANTASVTVTSRQADIGVTKTVDNATPSVGNTIHYTLTVTNHGPLYPVSSLLVRDIVPAALTIVSATPSQGSYVQGTGNWTIGNLANGASATMTVTATVAASGHIDNTLAFVSMLQTDSNSANNTATVGIDVQSAADLGVTKSESTNRPDVGSQITFTLTAHNYGPDNATGVAVADALPGGLSLVSSTPSAGTSYAAGTWTIGNLANGAGATLSIVANVTSAGAQTNTATISGSEHDPVAGNNSQSVSLDQRVNIALLKTVDKQTPNVGGTVIFTIVASNTNINTANNITITDALPAGLTFVSAAPGVGSYDAGTNIWAIPDLEPLSSVTMTMTATVADHIAMTNTATLSHVDEQQTSTADDSSSATVTPQQADLLVGKSVDDPSPEIGDVVTFTVTLVNNNGPDSATNVTVGDLLPGGLTFVSKTPSSGTSYNEGTGVWTVGTLARNATATLQIRATVAAGGIHTNTATVTNSDQYDPGPGVNTASATVASRVADIAVAKVVTGSATPQVGENTSFLVTVTNNGPDTATSLIVSDPLPGSLSYVSATPSQGSYAPGNGNWTIGSLASGAQATMTVVATVVASGQIDNTASFLSMLQTDSDDSNNSATATINVGTAADLAVTKTPSTTRPDVGSDVTFTITALNNGPDAATGVEVADVLPAGLTLVTATPSAGTWADSTWTIGSLGVGAPASQTLIIVAHVGAAGAITNNATISGTEYDPNAANNHDSATIDQRVHFVVTKSAAPADANVGTNTTFTIQVANTGPNTAHNVVVNDALPGGLTYVSDDGGGAYSGDVWTIPSIASGSSATLHVVARVDSQGQVTNTATVASVNETRSSTADDSASATVTPAQADLAVTKTVDNGKPELGDTIVFTVAVHNGGPDDATGVTLGDLLPAGLTWVSDDGGVDYDHTTGVWTIGGLDSGTTATLHVTATVSAKGDYTNTASVTASDQYDPNTIVTNPTDTNNVASAFVTTRVADIGVTKGVDNATPAVGTVITYTVTAINNGDDPASGLHISDVLPAGRLTFVSATPSGSTHYDAVTGDWNIGALAVTATATLTISARVIDSGHIDNTAAVSALHQRDDVAGNDSATIGIDAPDAADLSLTKTVDDNTPDKDATVVFTLTAANAGPNNTTGVVVTDALPGDLSYVSDDGGGAYDSATGHWTIGNLNKGAHATLHITATVSVGDKQITNEAEVTHSNLPDPDSTTGNGANGEDDYDSVILNAHGVADLSINKTISPTKLRKGDHAVYTIVLTNHGPQDATGVIVRDQLPSAVTYVSSTGGTYDSHTGAWTVGNLANGASVTLKITVTIGRTGTITNVASVTAADQRDPVSTNNQFTAGVSAAGPTPPVTASKDSGPLPRDPGVLILGVLGIAFAAIALLGYAAMSNRNRRRRLRL